MFIVNHQTNRISLVKIKTFSTLDFIERMHLHALFAEQHDALDEHLLIIQYKFYSFNKYT